MSDTGNATGEALAGQEPKGKSGNIQTGAMDERTFGEIVRSFAHLGALNVSNAAAARAILLAYARSKHVRRTVRQALPLVGTAVTDVEEETAQTG